MKINAIQMPMALVFGAAVMLGTTAAIAKEGRGMEPGKRGFMKASFDQLDHDKNGQITIDDLKAHAAARFATADANGDGQLSAEELKTYIAAMRTQGADAKVWRGEKRMERMVAKMISKRDMDGNGMLSLAEITPDQSRFEKMISRFDRDGDNGVSQAEFDAARAAFAKDGKGDCKDGHRHKRNGS